MKIFTYKIFCTLFILSFLALSCNKDEKVSPDNYFRIAGGEKIMLNKGYILDLGITLPGVYQMQVDFIGKGFRFDSLAADYPGTGSRIDFNFFSDIDDGLTTGTYSFDKDHSLQPFTFDFGFAMKDYNTAEFSGYKYEISEGTVMVFNEGAGKYHFTFLCRLSSGEQVTGSFQGRMTYVNYAK